jgi:hypothetical protein
MSEIKLSLVIPYKQRLDNIRLLFEGLVDQTMDRSQFEVIVGAMEYSAEYVDVCSEYIDRLNITTVMSARDFEVSRARNLAMRQSSGRVIVNLDADTLLAPAALENLYDHNFSYGQNACIVGQVIGYGNNMDGDVAAVESQPYSHYKKVLDGLWDGVSEPPDPRFQTTHVLPWAFAWTGLVALPAAAVRTHNLYFDEEFRGWGVEDLEWGFRVCTSGIPIILREEVYALHLPHVRDTKANHGTARRNFHRFLRKWPRPEIELVAAFDDITANDLFPAYRRELQAIMGDQESAFGVISGRAGGRRILLAGAKLDAARRVTDQSLLAPFDDPATVETLSLVGLALPYGDASFDEVSALPPVEQLSVKYRSKVAAELQRISKR